RPGVHARGSLQRSVRQRVARHHDRHRRPLRRSAMNTTSRSVVAAALLALAALGPGCAQLAGIEETSLGPKHAYACKCACTGGGESFSLNSNVCVPANLNPALNPDLPSDFVPSSEDLRQDCSTRVEGNLEQMARQCVADRIRCSCAGIAELRSSFSDCDKPC